MPDLPCVATSIQHKDIIITTFHTAEAYAKLVGWFYNQLMVNQIPVQAMTSWIFFPFLSIHFRSISFLTEELYYDGIGERVYTIEQTDNLGPIS